MMSNLKGELAIMDNLGIKPNYAALGRKYEMDPRTVKKYYNGYEGRSSTRNKGSKLDTYKTEIVDKLTIHRLTVQDAHRFLVNKYGIMLVHIQTLTNTFTSTNLKSLSS